MKRSVHYLMSGDAHAPYLLVSLCSLRQHFDGDVVIHAYPESMATVTTIAADSRLGVTAVPWSPVYRGKNGQFLNKTLMMQQLSLGANVYLDADTMVRGSLNDLFVAAESYGFAATQFCDWRSNSGVVRKRISNLLCKPGIDQIAVQYAMDNPMPSVNGGVFCCVPDSDALRLWYSWTAATIDLFICDETCLHAISAHYADSVDFTVLAGGSYNCSPKYKPANLSDDAVKIWHFHGDSNVRPGKSQKGFDLWYPEYEKCLVANIGGISQWRGPATEQNKHLKALETKTC